jgi:tetratricopeptide (TPR) repeat protein
LEAAALLDRCHQVLTTRSEIAISTEQRMSFYRVYAQLLDIEGRPGQYPAMLRRWRRECVQSGLALEGCRAAIETARLLWKQSRYRMTKRVLDQVISQAAGLGASEIEADGLLLRAELYRRLGDFPNACKSASEGLALAIQSDDQPKITDGQNKVGLAYWGMGKLAEAAICFEAALASVAAMESRYLTAKATNNLGIVLWESGRYREAMHRLQDAAELFRYVGDRRNEAYSKGNLAGLLKLMGQLSRAEQLYRQSGVIFERLKDSHAYHYTLGNLGDLALIRGDCESASRLFTDTMAFAHESGDQELQAECNIRFGELAYFSGEMESAQERFEDAINQATVIGSMEFLLRALIGSARKAVGMKDILGLDTLIGRIEEKAKAVPGSVALPEATFLRGEFHRLTGESDRAIDCFREVRDFSSDQGIFELRLKSNCRLFELNPTERQAVDELKELAREFHRENQPLEFKTVLGSVYYRFFAQSVIRALER